MAETTEKLQQNNALSELGQGQIPPQQLPPSTLLTSTNTNNNNRHLVSAGILIVLFTLYITAAAIQRNNYILNNNITTEKANSIKLNEKENQRQAMILEKLLEHENICSELEIFVKDFKWNESNEDYEEIKYISTEEETEIESKDDNSGDNPINMASKKNGERHRNGNRRLMNGKNGNGHHSKYNNKSIKSKITNKNIISNKKDEPKKKNATAEPIIYLFALVFIYLLLKAASDINQHYKSATLDASGVDVSRFREKIAQAKGDKRLRRCSLQSYAQTHKQDRRASKGIAYKNLPKI